VTGVGGTHHVLSVEHLLGKLGNGKSTVLLGTSGGKGSKTHHEEVKTGEWHHVHGKLAKIAVELTRETKGASGTADSSRHQVVKITVGRGGKLQGTEADIVKGLVIKGEALIRVLHKLVNRKGAVIRLHDGIRHLGEGMTEKVVMTRSGYSSRILEIRSVPTPAPVSPPMEWVSWKP
jgi:hypothetical protein